MTLMQKSAAPPFILPRSSVARTSLCHAHGVQLAIRGALSSIHAAYTAKAWAGGQDTCLAGLLLNATAAADITPPIVHAPQPWTESQPRAKKDVNRSGT
jgi:hypothetical protein